ncbi:MAG: P-II family nitrogen regulator [Clostridiales bacterium]|nr:P-II family nitrogen regulator [Clostridiales bacterium]
MTESSYKKALYIIVNIGFADEVAEIMRNEGAGGATIINARGSGAAPKSILGITIDTEKEIILSVVDEEMSEKIIRAVKEKAGLGTPCNSICFTMPVDKFVMTNPQAPSNGSVK